MWQFEQLSGRISRDGQSVGFGYSGFAEGCDNPAQEKIQGIGPIPVGNYLINKPEDTATHGPYVLPLTPAFGTDTFGRSGFLIHGDSKEHPGAASHGCIVLPRNIREHIWQSGDRDLAVVVSQAGQDGQL